MGAGDGARETEVPRGYESFDETRGVGVDSEMFGNVRKGGCYRRSRSIH